MSLAPYVRNVARGPGRGRTLSLDEAQAAMTLILSGKAEPEAVGALLMVLRYRGETAEELAGFAQAVRPSLPHWTGLRPALDWPAYAAGRTRGLPWFVLSALLVAQAGVPVLMHGWNAFQSPVADVRAALDLLGLPQAQSVAEAGDHLAKSNFAYAPLEILSPEAHRVLRLREILGLRSIMNTVVRMMNPGGAGAVVQGVFHPGYRPLQQDAAALMGLRDLSVIKGGGGEFERHPGKDITIFGLRDGVAFTRHTPALTPEHRRLAETQNAPADLRALWRGDLEDAFAHEIVLGTAAIALETCGRAAEGAGLALAQDLWSARRIALAA
ncbi:glycosyl transferase family protein [Puniceibacterium sp. IMCC21224]|uniref:glycosyl transferase family protein n=1 Tax=Puniceibacterium sp. IMCC21224 TaxID=1618204 RepID=UPI00064DD3B9|nr:glycosyl transferase family protein [Puniceibacterium sp. IMCC21224]KMK68013.1 anthranilate phosphoribosyltransferase [Puniceibacterium sp. IMCC21224]